MIGFGGLGGVSEGLNTPGVVEKSLGTIIRVKGRPLAAKRAAIVSQVLVQVQEDLSH